MEIVIDNSAPFHIVLPFILISTVPLIDKLLLSLSDDDDDEDDKSESFHHSHYLH
ncbi:MAG TPA: hypothetical protein VFV86_01110 [Nitrososphaeraceae archaeon]|nr:hypothetical protein [Nitrososphaeraceae archaeon]